MRTKRCMILTHFTLMGLILIFSNSCKKEKTDNNNDTPIVQVPVPIITTDSVINITQTTATCGGKISSDGGVTITARGVCWSSDHTPTVADFKTNDGSGSGTYVSNIFGLAANTNYYARAYATNSNGTGYGNVRIFTTSNSSALLPLLTTAGVSNITGATATCGGDITSDGGSTVSVRGVCWSTVQNPTISDSKTTDGSGAGIFSSNISGLTTNMMYHVRAYATNSNGTNYGNEIIFTSSSGISLGQSYQGGIIVYILQPGDNGYDSGVPHGLIAATTDQSGEWGCYSTDLFGSDGTAIGTGNQNTTDIINGCTQLGIAARVCYDLVSGGYSDWYLPSRDELNKLYINQNLVGGFSYSWYWSSSEIFYNGDPYAYSQDFRYGTIAYGVKNTVRSVRAVRSF